MQYAFSSALMAAAINAFDFGYGSDQYGQDHIDAPQFDHIDDSSFHGDAGSPFHDSGYGAHESNECPDLSHLKNFDVPEYQIQSAYCKQQMIWKNVIADRTPQQFFVGPEFGGFFKQDMNLSFDSVTDTMP